MNTFKLKKRLQSEKGIALVIVLMAVLALMIIIVEFAYTTRVHYSMAQNLRDRLQAEYLARSALQISLLVLKFQKQIDSVQERIGSNVTLFGAGPLYQQIPIDSILLRAALGGGEGGEISLSNEEQKDMTDFLSFSGDFFARIEDEQGKINVNALASTLEQGAQGGEGAQGSPTPTPTPAGEEEKVTVSQVTYDQMLALVDSKDYDSLFKGDYTREEVIYNIMDWVDEDKRRSGFEGGQEDNLYINKEPPYRSKNAKFDSIEEIALVEGVDQEFLNTFQSSLTVYGNTNQININTATRILLYGIVGKLIGSKNEEEILEIVDWIDEFRNFKDQAEFLEGLQTGFGFETADLDEVLLGTLVFESTYFSITANGTVGDSVMLPGARPITATIQVIVTENTSSSNPSSRSKPFPGGMNFLYWRIQ